MPTLAWLVILGADLIVVCCTLYSDHCSTDAGSATVSCVSCRDDVGTEPALGINGIPSTVIRFSDRDLSTYNLPLKWEGGGFKMDNDAVVDFSSDLLPGYAIHAAFPFFLILLLISFACWCCGRCMWWCCLVRCCASCCGGCCDKCCARLCFCSKIWAACTLRCSCHCSQRTGPARVQKLSREFWPNLCVTSFVIATVAMVIVAQVSGNRGITTGIVELAGVGDRLQRVIQSTAPHVESTLMQVAGVGLVDVLRSVNGTVVLELQPKELADSLSCVDSMVVALPPGDELRALVQETEQAIALLPGFVPTRALLVDLDSLLKRLPLNISKLDKNLVDTRDAVAPFGDLSSTKEAIRNIGNSTHLLSSTIDNATSEVLAMQAALPSTTEINQTVTSGSQILTLGGRSDWDEALDSPDALRKEAWRSDYKANLTRLKRDVAAVPNAANLVEGLRQVNKSLDAMVDEITALVPEIEMVQAQISAVPPMKELKDIIRGLHEDVGNVSFDAILTTISKLDAGVEAFPDIANVKSFVTRLQNAMSGNVCLARLGDRLVHINQTLLWMPTGMEDAKKRIDDLQVDIDEALHKSTELEEEMGEMNATIEDLPDFNKTDRQIKDLRAKSENATGNLTKVYSDLDEAEASLDVNLTKFTKEIEDIENTLTDPSTRPSEFLLDTLTDMSKQLDTLPQVIQRGLDAINRWEMGVCITADNNGDMCRCDNMSLCNGGLGFRSFIGSSSNCTGPGATCIMKFSASGVGACTKDINVPCTSDGECIGIGKGKCTLPDLSEVISDANDFSSSSQDMKQSSDDMLDSMAEAQDEIDELPNTDEKIAEIAEIERESVDAVVEINDRIDEVAKLKKQLDDAPDMPELISQLDDIDRALADLQSGTLTEARDNAKTLDDAVDEYNSEDMDATRSTVRYLNDFVYHDLERHMANISMTALAAAARRDGLAEMLLVLSSVIDSLHADMLNKGSLFDDMATITLKSDIESELPRVRNFQDRDGSRLNKGGFSYLYMLLSDSLLADGGASSASQQRTFRGLYDATSGEFTRYADDKVCVSRPCLTNTLKILNTEPLGDALPVIGLDADLSYLSLTRENVFMVPFIVPVLVMLFGTVTCICGRARRVRKCCGCLTACTAWCGAICILFFVGMLFFPLTIFISDVCYSTENVGFVLLRDNAANICKELHGNLDTSVGGGRCNINPNGLGEVTIDIDLINLYRDVLGKCEGWAVDDAWASVADAIYQHINNEIRLQLDNRAGARGEIRHLLAAPILEGVANISQMLRSGVRDVGSAMSCDALRHSYYDFKNSLCCGVASAWSVWVVAWYAMSFAMLCCALPAAVTFTRYAQDQQSFKKSKDDPSDPLVDVSTRAPTGASPQDADESKKEGDQLGVVDLDDGQEVGTPPQEVGEGEEEGDQLGVVDVDAHQEVGAPPQEVGEGEEEGDQLGVLDVDTGQEVGAPPPEVGEGEEEGDQLGVVDQLDVTDSTSDMTVHEIAVETHGVVTKATDNSVSSHWLSL